MKRLLATVLVFIAVCLHGQADQKDYLDSLAQDACLCMDGLPIDTNDRVWLTQKLGICLLTKAMAYKEPLKEDGVDLDFLDRTTGNKLGMLIAARMIAACPEISLKVFSNIAKDQEVQDTYGKKKTSPDEQANPVDSSSLRSNIHGMRAKIISVDTNVVVRFKVEVSKLPPGGDQTLALGDTITVYWLRKINGGEAWVDEMNGMTAVKKNVKSLEGSFVVLSYKDEEWFDASVGAYAPRKVLGMLQRL